MNPRSQASSPPMLRTLSLISFLLFAACAAPSENSINGRADKSIGAAAGSLPTALATGVPAQTPAAFPPITLPISIYIIDDESGQLSSVRDDTGVVALYEQVNQIWVQAGIVIEIQSVQRLTLPQEVVQGIVRGNFRPFLSEEGISFSILDPSLLNAFYASAIGGPNGIAPSASNLFFVADTPSVRHERVTSHEIGHLLGLHHTFDDPDQLMFPGSNGTTLTDEEITVARYIARGILDRLR